MPFCPTALPGRFAIELQNQSAVANLWCGQDAGAVTTTSGRKITPGMSWQLQIGNKNQYDGAMSIWCVNDGAAGTTTAECTQLK